MILCSRFLHLGTSPDSNSFMEVSPDLIWLELFSPAGVGVRTQPSQPLPTSLAKYTTHTDADHNAAHSGNVLSRRALLVFP